MKALLYKEFKLAMHPICYVFICIFPLMILIPSYPIAVGFICILSCYPIIFLGANKGQQSNDLLYSTLLPVRKKDIVLARILTISIIQFVFIAIMSCLYPVAVLINQNIPLTEEQITQGLTSTIPGIPLEGYVSILAIAILGYAIADIIFFPIYYKNGKSIVMSTLFTIFGFIFYLAIFTIVLPYIPVIGEAYKGFLCGELWIQFTLLAGALLIYVGIHFLVYKISSERLEKVDF